MLGFARLIFCLFVCFSIKYISTERHNENSIEPKVTNDARSFWAPHTGRLIGVVNSAYHEKLGLLLHHEDEEDYIWNYRHSLGCIFGFMYDLNSE